MIEAKNLSEWKCQQNRGMSCNHELATSIYRVMDQDKQREDASWGQGCLGLIQEIETIWYEPCLQQMQK
jgi:hypothetical protein